MHQRSFAHPLYKLFAILLFLILLLSNAGGKPVLPAQAQTLNGDLNSSTSLAAVDPFKIQPGNYDIPENLLSALKAKLSQISLKAGNATSFGVGYYEEHPNWAWINLLAANGSHFGEEEIGPSFLYFGVKHGDQWEVAFTGSEPAYRALLDSIARESLTQEEIAQLDEYSALNQSSSEVTALAGNLLFPWASSQNSWRVSSYGYHAAGFQSLGVEAGAEAIDLLPPSSAQPARALAMETGTVVNKLECTWNTVLIVRHDGFADSKRFVYLHIQNGTSPLGIGATISSRGQYLGDLRTPVFNGYWSNGSCSTQGSGGFNCERDVNPATGNLCSSSTARHLHLGFGTDRNISINGNVVGSLTLGGSYNSTNTEGGGGGSLNPPTLVSPGQGQTLTSRSAHFTWQSPNATNQNGYTFRLSTSSNPDTQPWLKDTGLGNEYSSYDFNFASDGTFYWHMRTWNSSNQASGWVTRSFVINTSSGGGNHPPAGFTWCADEDGRCSFSGSADVVYGALDSFTSPRSFSNGVDCNNSVFGDPINGTRKACYYKQTASQTGNLHVEYFNDKNLGSRCYDGYENSTYIFKNWSNSAPANGCNTDNFSARFTGTYNFSGGSYSFHCQHDDGCRILIDGQEKLNAWWDSSFTGHDWGGNLSGNHEVRVEFYDSGGEARLEAFWSGAGFLPTGPSCTAGEWCAQYFGNRTLSGTPAIQRNEGNTAINYTWNDSSLGYGFPSDNFSARWQRNAYFAAGRYRFHIKTDDGGRLWVNNNLVIDQWHDQGSTEYTTDLDLAEGEIPLKFEFYEGGGGAVAQLWWDTLQLYTDEATFVTQSLYPTVNPGDNLQIYFEVRNTGTTTWQPGSYWLQNLQYPLGAGTQRSISQAVPPNGTVRWTIDQTAPGAAGTYRSQWMVSHNGTLFGPNMFIDVTVANTDDAYEENDTLGTAYDLSNNEQTWLSSLHGTGVQADPDWYRIYVTPGFERVQVYADFTHSQGDIDIALYNTAGTLLSVSQSVSDDEYIAYKVPAGGAYYYIQVYYENAGNAYNLWWDDTIPGVDVYIGGYAEGSYFLNPGQSLRDSYSWVNNGPVIVASSNGPIVASERVAFSPDGGNTWTSHSELMGMPADQVSTSYTFPWYNNADINSQLRFGNVGASSTNVTVMVGGVVKGVYSLAPNASQRVSYAGLNAGPVKVTSSGNVPIIASLRVAYSPDGGTTWPSFSEMMGLPSSKLTTSYTFPWYNNFDLNTQLRFGNVGNAATVVTVSVGGVVRGTYPLGPNQGTRVSYPGLNNGPVRVTSSGGVPIIASIRVAYTPNNVTWTDFSEMMGMPTSSLSTSYSFPVYNNVNHNTQVRFGNVGSAATMVTVTVGGVVKGTYSLAPNQSTRVSYTNLNDGPIVVSSSGGVKIIASERVAYFDGGLGKWTSFSEMMGLPQEQLTTAYLFPWYNNIDLDTQIRFGVP